MKIKVQEDFMGPYIDTGRIMRPSLKTEMNLSEKIVLKQKKYSSDILFIDVNGRSEIWSDCGDSSAYHEAKATLSKDEFERFALLGCGYEFAGIKQTRELYPQLQSVFPEVKPDNKKLQEYLELEKKLREQSIEKKNKKINTVDQQGSGIKLKTISANKLKMR